MSRPEPVYHLALRELHAANGAVFNVAAGWTVPMRYGDPAAELVALRRHAAVFDRSSRSRFLVSGTDALEVLKAVFAGHVEDLEEGRAMRTVALGPDGRIDDVALIARILWLPPSPIQTVVPSVVSDPGPMNCAVVPTGSSR